MTLKPVVTRVLTEAVQQVCDELEAKLQGEARSQGVSPDLAQTLHVTFQDGAFQADSSSEEFLEQEFGGPGRPPLALLRRFNARLPRLSGELLDKHAGRLLSKEGVL